MAEASPRSRSSRWAPCPAQPPTPQPAAPGPALLPGAAAHSRQLAETSSSAYTGTTSSRFIATFLKK